LVRAGSQREKMEEDLELKLIEQRKLAELRKRMLGKQQGQKEEKSDRELVLGMLYDRGDEVLEAAYSFYPKETERIVAEIARLIREGKLKEKVSGGELYAIFRQLGLRFSLRTSIKVQEHGKLVDLSEKLSLKGEE
jgi:DNA-binding TFAR19-related protein (PDSD5 family)